MVCPVSVEKPAYLYHELGEADGVEEDVLVLIEYK
jgi:hypothetical protein